MLSSDGGEEFKQKKVKAAEEKKSTASKSNSIIFSNKGESMGSESNTSLKSPNKVNGFWNSKGTGVGNVKK